MEFLCIRRDEIREAKKPVRNSVKGTKEPEPERAIKTRMNMRHVVEEENVFNVRNTFHLAERFFAPHIEFVKMCFDFTWKWEVYLFLCSFAKYTYPFCWIPNMNYPFLSKRDKTFHLTLKLCS